MIARQANTLTESIIVLSTFSCLILIQGSFLARASILTDSTTETSQISTKTSAATTAALASRKPGTRTDDSDDGIPLISTRNNEKRAFVTELLLLLHEQYGGKSGDNGREADRGDNLQSRQGQLGFGPDMMQSQWSVGLRRRHGGEKLHFK